jgi:hypothetical protein
MHHRTSNSVFMLHTQEQTHRELTLIKLINFHLFRGLNHIV